jgi:RNA polymerase sigma-70 factor, ECF subfamily
MCQSDEHCIAECLDGRPDVFRELVVRYERPLLGYLTRRMGDPDAAAEVAQESFVRAYFQLGTLKTGDAFFAWLLGIAQRVMLESFRRRRPHSLSDVDDPADPSTDPAAEDDGELAEAVARLPDVYREVTVLRYFGGLSCAQVSQRLGVPLGTVTKRLSRAYGLLRESLAPQDDRSNKVRR